VAATEKKNGNWLLSPALVCLIIVFNSAFYNVGPALAAPRLMLSGAVIRYERATQALTKEQWLHIMDDISSLGIKTIVIQYHHFIPGQRMTAADAVELDFLPRAAAAASSISPTQVPAQVSKPDKKLSSAAAKAPDKILEEKIDASGIILDYADAHHMTVYMGLWMDQNWYGALDVLDQLAHNLSRAKYDLVQLQNELTTKNSDTARTPAEIKAADAEIAVCKRGLAAVQEELEEKSLYFAATKNGPLAGPTISLADSLARLYGKHQSFVGWYFPEEIWDAAFSNETISVLNPLLKFISGHCQELSSPLKRSFAMSPYASRLHYDSVDEIVAAQSTLLKDTGVDVLMLQDSVGDLNLKEDEDISVRLKKHFTAFSKVAANLNIRLWAELESFEQVGRVRKPTNIARFKKQFQYSYPYLDKTNPVYVVYDYLHYLSLIDAKMPDADLRAKLYDDYKREFVDSTFTPPIEKAND